MQTRPDIPFRHGIPLLCEMTLTSERTVKPCGQHSETSIDIGNVLERRLNGQNLRKLPFPGYLQRMLGALIKTGILEGDAALIAAVNVGTADFTISVTAIPPGRIL